MNPHSPLLLSFNSATLFRLKRSLGEDLEAELFQLSLYHVSQMLAAEFGQPFARHFQQDCPKAFFKLVKTTQTELTWRGNTNPKTCLTVVH